MAVPAAAEAHYLQQQAIASQAATEARKTWSRLDPGALVSSWTDLRIADQLFTQLTRAQILAASTADGYADRVLAEQGIGSDPFGLVDPLSLGGVSSDGRTIEGLLLSPLITANAALARGQTAELAMSYGLSSLTRIMATQVQDAGRTATGIAVATRNRTGMVRMLRPPSCGRCAVLAGRYYPYSRGFLRHPHCDCQMIPTRENVAGDVTTDAAKYFGSLSGSEQERLFTKSGARAINDGADISQVVNARRGASGLSQPGRLTADEQKALRGGRDIGRLSRTDVYGEKVFLTSEGTTPRGAYGAAVANGGFDKSSTSRYARTQTPRLMPESIYEIAENRADAVRLLTRFGYIT